MLVSSERVVAQTATDLIRKVNLEISTLEKANNSKPIYSARQIFKVLGEINDHNSYGPDKQIRLKTPSQLNSLRLDSYMSVFNVESSINPVRHRSLTKNYGKYKRNTLYSQDELEIKLKKATQYNKIEPLKQSEQELQKRKKFQQIQEGAEDQFRAQLEKKLLIVPDEKRKTKPKIINVQELKQKFSYDYESNRIKIKSQIKGLLISSNKSLTAHVSKGIFTKALAKKIDKPLPISLQTKLVVEKKKKEKKSKKQKQQSIQEIVAQPIEVQFSKISSLTERMQCEPGVSLNFNGHYLKNKKVNTLPNQINSERQKPIQYSKLEYLLLKKRSSTSLSNIEGLAKKSLNKKQSIQTNLQISGSLPNLTLNSSRTHHLPKSRQKILIQNTSMHKYLLSPQNEPNTANTENSPSQKKAETLKTEITLDRTDRFNINYIRGMKNISTNAAVEDRDREMMLTPKNGRVPYFRVREKLENKMMLIGEFKKKFQDTLRSSQQSSSLMEN